MNLRPRRHEEPEINLTPLIDVVFLMLIFFMVSTHFVEEENIVKVDLPKASSEALAEDKKIVEVTINAKGEYFIYRKVVVNRDPKTLKAAIIRHAGTDNDRPFVIRADAKAPHQSVVTVMDVAGQLGYSRISIPTVRGQEK